MSQYRVEKEQVGVTVVMLDGANLSAGIFLSAHSSTGTGPQDLLEVLEDDTDFLPVKDFSGNFVLVGKRMIAALTSSVEADPTPDFSRRVKASLKVEGCGELEGELIIPDGPAAFRVSDYLNGAGEWLRLEAAGDVAMISKKAVKEIRLI